MVTRPPRRRVLNPANQAFALSREFSGSRVELRRGTLIWTGELQPTEISRRYVVRVTFGHDRLPLVRVVSPVLEPRPGESLPHVYEDGTLCLYSRGEWDPSMFLAWTIIPWTSEWLINYEIWVATDEWYGGGEWPPNRSVPEVMAL
jgi:hypothetical protein